MSLPGALSDEAIKKKCSPFFVSNLKVAELADPKPPFKENEFLNGLVNPPRHPSRRPTRPYDDISNFLVLSGGTNLIQKAVDEYADEVKTIYKKNGGAKEGSSASTQLPLMLPLPDSYKQVALVAQPKAEYPMSRPQSFYPTDVMTRNDDPYDDDYDFGERPSYTMMSAAITPFLGAAAYYMSRGVERMSWEERHFRRLVHEYDAKYGETGVKHTPLRKAMISHFEQEHGIPADDRVHREVASPGSFPFGHPTHYTAHSIMQQLFDAERDIPNLRGYHDSYVHAREMAGEAGLDMGFLYDADKPNEFPYGME
jgi:hypothetical protein